MVLDQTTGIKTLLCVRIGHIMSFYIKEKKHTRLQVILIVLDAGFVATMTILVICMFVRIEDQTHFTENAGRSASVNASRDAI